MKFSIVIPVHNEEGNIINLFYAIDAVLSKLDADSEIIFVDDGSNDGTRKVLEKIGAAKVIYFKKRFGQTAALDAGIKASKGEYIVTIDGDGQNDPDDIPNLYNHLISNELDCVCGWRKDRQDSYYRKALSKVAYFFRKLVANDKIHDSGCTLKIYRKECLQDIELYGEMHRFIPALLVTKGYNVGEIPVKHFPRKHGVSKYGLTRSIKGFLDILGVLFWRKYVNRPLHLFGTAGIFIFLVSGLTLIWLVYRKIFMNVDLSETVLTDFSLFGLIVGIQFIAFGLLADMLSKIYFSQEKHSTYTIDKIDEK